MILSINCMDCNKTVYGQDWLSGGMCANCNMKYDLKIFKLREEQAKNYVFTPYETCNCDDCIKHFKK